MLNPFKIFGIIRKSNKGIHHTEDFVHELSFDFIAVYFIVVLILLGLFTGISLFFGFVSGLGFFKILSLILVLLFVIILRSFIVLKKKARSMTDSLVQDMKQVGKSVVHTGTAYSSSLNKDDHE